MSKKSEKDLEEGIRTLARAAALIALVFITGVIGYSLLGGEEYGIFDAIYMTMITLTTVGYGETINLEGNLPGRMFTTVLLVFGVGGFVYFFSNFTAFMVEGHFDRLMWNRKMRKMINALSDHFIVCGAGDTGEHLVKELIETERPFVVIDSDPERIDELTEKYGAEFPVVIGDATDDDALRAAGIERARSLTACISSDKDNLLVIVSARLLNPKLRLICRCVDEKIMYKVRKAGADAVVSPNMIGGLRMVSEMIRPNVVTFLDVMLRDKDKGLRVEEFAIEKGSRLAGITAGDFRAKHLEGVLLVAVKLSNDDWTFNPKDDMRLEPGMHIVYMGNPAARTQIAGLA